MKILLIQPYTFTVRGLPQIPLALMYVGGHAEKHGHTVKILDRNIETDGRRVIDDYKPDVLGITSLTGRMILDGIKISKYIREKYRDAKIIWGGVHASILPQNTLQENYIDYVVIGEGEETFVELLEVIDQKRAIQDIKGVGYKSDGAVIINEPRKPITDLDDIALVPWHLIDTKKYLKHETLFISSRGCPHRCAFCYNEKFNFRKWRGMSPDRVKAEIDHAQTYHPIRRLRFDDDNFTVNKKRFHRILDVLPKATPLYFASRIEYIDEDFCRHVSEFKDAFVFLGVESGDDDMLRRMRKDITVDQIKHAYRLINSYKIKTSASFIIGSPGETREQLKKTLTMIDEIDPTRPSCCIFVPFPGSVFTESLFEEGRLEDVNTLADWGHFSDSENARGTQFSEISNSELNKIYNRYWWKFVWRFVRTLRFNWILFGIQNITTNYFRIILKRLRKDI